MRADDSLADLEDRIRLAEARLVAREDRLHDQLGQLSDGVRDTLRPQRAIGPAAAGAGTLLSLWWLLRRRRGVHAGLPWLRILGLAGPLVPVARRLLAHASAPPVLRLEAGDAARVNRAALPPVDPTRWAGRWIELAGTPVRQASQTPAAVDVHYLLRHDGSYEVVRRSIDPQRRQRTQRGLAQPLQGGDGAVMRISLWPAWMRVMPLAWDEHCVLHVEPDYEAALVGRRNGSGLSLLARDAALPQERLLALLQRAREQGYAVDALRFTRVGATPD